MERNNSPKCYRRDIDLLKGIAILAVIFYHMGLVKNGYLGVDIFLVLNGFLILPSMYNESIEGKFDFRCFFHKRVLRLYPLLVAVCAVSLVIGFFTMFPDDLNTLSESVIATLMFSNNLLSFYLCSDYWDWTNDFKPLMHTWYLGVLLEIYLYISLLCLIFKDKFHNRKADKALRNVICVSAIISMFLFLFPYINKNIKFYFFPFRLFEFCAGGCVGIYGSKITLFMQKRNKGRLNVIIYYICIIAVILLFLQGMWNRNIPNTVLVMTTVILTCLCILSGETVTFHSSLFLTPIFKAGRISYSLFLWHQVILAFFRLCFSTSFSPRNVFLYWIILIPIVLISYSKIEKMKYSQLAGKLILASTVFLVVIPFIIWTRAGIVRDIPELEISRERVERRKFPHYVDRIYDYYHNFTDSE